MRRIQFGGFEHQQREITARDFHQSEGPVTVWGNGATVMKVSKARRPFVEVIGEDGLNEFGKPFVYGDYFHPEEPGKPEVVPKESQLPQDWDRDDD